MALIDKEILDQSVFRSDQESKSQYAKSAKSISDGTTPAERQSAIAKTKTEPVDFAYERTVGKNDSVYSNYAELLISAKRKVGRIVIRQGLDIKGYATAFLVSKELILTNWHVFKTIDLARDSILELNYEIDERSNETQRVTFKLLPERFYHSMQRLDYCFVAVNNIDVKGEHSLSDFGCFYLDPSVGKVQELEYLSVIHHPGGDYKQLGIRENQLEKKLEEVLWYKTDTAQGSSGCPVLNDQFQVVALHHGGVPVKQGDGYLSKNGVDIIRPDSNGKIDETQLKWIANEGIRISVILNDLNTTFPNNEVVNELKKITADADVVSQKNERSIVKQQKATQEDTTTKEYQTMQNENDIKIAIPSTLLQSGNSVDVRVSLNGNNISTQKSDDDEKEQTGIEKIQPDKNYSNRKGYSPDFLGVSIPFPKLGKTLLKSASRLISIPQEYILKYNHFSTINHAVRGMPIVTASNIDGNLDQNIPRKDAPKESDTWYTDPRISEDEQTSNWFYKGSGFDRGHMVRREDAGWGKTYQEAKLANDDTFHFPNCCPQHKLLNQKIWADLEDYILNKSSGVMRAMKICVFTGPIFDSEDQSMKGVQVPMSFFKIVGWISDTNKLKATAFRMKQPKEIKDLNWDETFDFSKDFKTYQLSIAKVGSLTDIDFGPLKDADTYQGDENQVNGTEDIKI